MLAPRQLGANITPLVGLDDLVRTFTDRYDGASAKTYASVLRAFIRHAGVDTYGELGEQHVIDFATAQTQRGREPANNTVWQRLKAIRRFCVWANRTYGASDFASHLAERGSPLHRRATPTYGKIQSPNPARFLTYDQAYNQLLAKARSATGEERLMPSVVHARCDIQSDPTRRTSSDTVGVVQDPRGSLPTAIYLAGVMVAYGVAFVLVGSAGLWLQGESSVGSVGDLDIVPDPQPRNLEEFRSALTAIGLRPIPPLTSWPRLDVLSVPTIYGKLDCLLTRARIEYRSLLAGADRIVVSDAPVTVASIEDGWRLRHQFRGQG